MIQITENGKHRIIQDNLNGRLYKEEWKCHVCGDWVDEQDIVWALVNGELSVDKGNPYCSGCVPNEEE